MHVIGAMPDSAKPLVLWQTRAVDKRLAKHYESAVRRFERKVLRRSVYAYGTVAYGMTAGPGACRNCGRHVKRRCHTYFVLGRLKMMPYDDRESRKRAIQPYGSPGLNSGDHCAACVLDFVMENDSQRE